MKSAKERERERERETAFVNCSCKKNGYNIDVLRQTACLVVHPIKVNNFAYLFDCTTIVRVSD